MGVRVGYTGVMNVGELSQQEFKDLVKESIAEALDELLGDDAGLELRPEVVERLRASLAAGQEGISTVELANRLGIKLT
ncbi:MAG: hypothetical protein C0506_14200 [Anaerolinea sp.]|nr:hypothetical protein [Anaerolinea sp.]